MPPRSSRTQLNIAVTTIALTLLCARLSAQTGSGNALPAQHSVERGNLTLFVEREGRIESAETVRVRLVPEEYKGSFEVAEVGHRSGRVKKGDFLLRFDGEALENEIITAQMAADHAKRKLQIALDEQRILAEANAMKREQVQKNRVNAEKEAVIWEKYDSPGMLKGAELTLKQREYGLADQKQELQQLEEMYSGTHLATETKDIVLDRARRGVTMSEAWLVLAVNSELVTREYRHPIQDRNVKDALRFAMQEEAHTMVNLIAAEQRKEMELEAAKQTVKDAERRLSKLQHDKRLLTLVAPADGVMTRIELEPRDIVNARQTVCEILDTSKLRVKFSITPEDLRAVHTDAAASNLVLQLPEYPEISVNGTVEELTEIGAAADNATHYPLTVTLKANHPMIRLGMRCKLLATHSIPDVLTIPLAAVSWDKGVAWCSVQTPEGVQKKQITVGASNRDRVIVTEGLVAGDTVVLPEVSQK